MRTFENLAAFQNAVALVVEVYRLTEAFPRREIYGLTSQMRRASVAVPSDIAEGQGRLSLGEWRHFLSEARGSLFEIQARAIVANRLGFLSDDAHAQLREAIQKAARPLAGLLSYVRKRERLAKTRQPTTEN
jgi:four helix bundle protein